MLIGFCPAVALPAFPSLWPCSNTPFTCLPQRQGSNPWHCCTPRLSNFCHTRSAPSLPPPHGASMPSLPRPSLPQSPTQSLTHRRTC